MVLVCKGGKAEKRIRRNLFTIRFCCCWERLPNTIFPYRFITILVFVAIDHRLSDNISCGGNIGGKWIYSDRFSQPATGEKNPVNLQTENYVEILKKKNWIPSFHPMDEWIIVPAPIVPCSPTLSDFPSTASIHPADS